ncbi:MAG: hypothetical protein ACT4P7_10380 [Gemmatimonadaceae bacterium]
MRANYRATVAITAVLTLPEAWTSVEAQKPDSTLLRATTVTVVIAADPETALNGTYSASGISTMCGLADYGYPHRLNSFAVMFPDDTGKKDVTSVNFDADTLASGTSVGSFYLAVGIRTRQGGTPPLYVIRAKEPQYSEPGTATLTTRRNRVDSLEVAGTASKGRKVSVKMTLVCQP